MTGPSPSQRVLRFAHDMRLIMKSTAEHFGEEPYPLSIERLLANAGELVDCARQAGAFADLDLARRVELDRQKERQPKYWREATFALMCHWFLVDEDLDWKSGVDYRVVFDRMADILEREAVKLSEASPEVPQYTPQAAGETNISKVLSDSQECIKIIERDRQGEELGRLRVLCDELQCVTQEECNVFSAAAGQNQPLFDGIYSSGHECLFALMQDLRNRLETAEDPAEEYKSFPFPRHADWRQLVLQVGRERVKVEHGLAGDKLEMIRIIQSMPNRKTESVLDGTFPEGSRTAKRRKAAQKGAETRRRQKQEKIEEDQRRASVRQKNEPRKPQTKDWLAWAMRTGKIRIVPRSGNSFRVEWPDPPGDPPSQTDVAAILSFILEDSVAQQRISDMVKKVEAWREMNLPEPDFDKLVPELEQREVTFRELAQLIDDKGDRVAPGRRRK